MMLIVDISHYQLLIAYKIWKSDVEGLHVSLKN